MNLLSCQEYRKYIRSELEKHTGIRGYQGTLAKSAGCQNSYFSRVLSGKANLNAEQAMRLALYWKLSEPYTDYWNTLVSLGRTDFPPLRQRLKAKLDSIRDESQNLKNRIQEATSLEIRHGPKYYSAWYWSAIHIVVGIPGYQTAHTVADRLGLPFKLVEHCLVELREMNLVVCEHGLWKALPTHIHLPKDSPYTSINHSNWRSKAVLSAQLPGSDDMHYTCVQSHTHADFTRIKDVFLESLDRARGIIKPSNREELSCTCIDFFRV